MNLQSILSGEQSINPITLAIITLALALILQYLFEHVVRRLLAKTKTKADDDIIMHLKWPAFLTVFLGSAYYYFSSNTAYASFKPIEIVYSITVVIWTIASIRIIHTILDEIEGKYQKGQTINDATPFLKNLTSLGMGLLALSMLLDIWGIDVTPLLASAGVAGLAVAFAAKDTIGNFFGGISIFFDKPFKTGDYVIINETYRGEVIAIGMRSTKIRTRSNVLITIPNSTMVTEAVINETGFDPKLRINIPLGVEYGADLERIEKIILKRIKSSKLFLEDPPSVVRFREFGPSSINLEILGSVKTPADKGRTTHEMIKILHKELKKEKITIPFPQQDVHIKKK